MKKYLPIILCVTIITGIVCIIAGIMIFNNSKPEEVSEDKVFTYRDLSGDYDKSSAVKIELKDNATVTSSDSVKVESNTVTIKKEDTYYITGSMKNGQIVVNAEDAKVQLVLDGVSIANTDFPSIYVKNAKKVFLTLVDGTTTTLTNTDEFYKEENEKANGVIYAKDDLVINGTGTLNVTTKYSHAIVCNDTLKVTNGNINLTAEKKCLKVKDNISITAAKLNLNAGTDGIHSDEVVYIKDGNINITHSNEGIEGEDITINGGTITINSEDDGINATSKKSKKQQEKAENNPFNVDKNAIICINGGTITINAKGDGIDSNGNINVTGGKTIVYGPQDARNAALDYSGEAEISGGIFVAIGNSGMAQNFTTAKQGSMLVNLKEYLSDDIILKNSKGKKLIEIDNNKSYNSVLISTPDIAKGETYTLNSGKITQTVEMTDYLYGESFDIGNFINGRPPQGQMPQGDPPSDLPQGQMPQGDPPSDFPQGDMPQGEPPSDFPQGDMPQGDPPSDFPQGDMPQGNPPQMNDNPPPAPQQ